MTTHIFTSCAYCGAPTDNRPLCELHEAKAQNEQLLQDWEAAESALDAIRDLADDRAERIAELVEAAQRAINGFRRWKRNQKRGGDRYEAEHGLTDLGQAVWDLDQILNPSAESDAR